MTDDDSKAQGPNFVPSPLPETFTIPSAILDQWFQIPANDRIQAPLTRSEIDHLILGLLGALEAQGKIDQALTQWSNGDLNGANAAIFEARRLNIESQNRIRQLANALMASGIRERHNAK
jgi:hypothetical protein